MVVALPTVIFTVTRHPSPQEAPVPGGAGLIAAVVLILSNWPVLVDTSSGLPGYLWLVAPLVVAVGVCWPVRPEPAAA